MAVVSKEYRELLDAVRESGAGELVWEQWYEKELIPTNNRDMAWNGRYVSTSVMCARCETWYEWADFVYRIRSTDPCDIMPESKRINGRWHCSTCAKHEDMPNIQIANRGWIYLG